MDGAGRKIELKVQSLLMDRLLGMRRGKAGQSPSGLFSAVREFGSVREFFTASTIGTLTDLPFIVGLVCWGHLDGFAQLLLAKENDSADTANAGCIGKIK